MISTWVEGPKGEVYINDVKKYVKGSILVPPAVHNPVTVPAAPAANNPGVSPIVIFQSPEGSAVEVFSFVGGHDGTVAAEIQQRLTVLLTETAYRRNLMNRAVLVDHVFGTQQTPLNLFKTMLLEGHGVIQAQFFNNSAAGQALYRSSLKVREFKASSHTSDQVGTLINEARKENAFITPYWLTTNQDLQLAAGATGINFFQGGIDEFMILKGFMCRAIIVDAAVGPAPAGDPQEIISFMLYDGKTDRALMNQPVTLNTATGNANFQFFFPVPWLIEPRNNIRIELQNLVTNKAVQVFFTFHGVKLFMVKDNLYTSNIVSSAMPGAAQYGV